MAKTFSDYAYEKMIDLYNNHDHEVGSQIASRHPDKEPTDCITYIINVLKYAFDKVGKTGASNKVGTLGKHGNLLQKYLVNTHKWTGIYYNPDVSHPADGQLEHPYSYFKKVKPVNLYYEVPITHSVINYNPTPKSDSDYASFSGLGGSKKPTTKDTGNLDELKKIKFAVGISRGAKHTWLYSLGKIYEVHWDTIGSGLYEASKFEDYDWLSGALAVPPDAMTAARFNSVASLDSSAATIGAIAGGILGGVAGSVIGGRAGAMIDEARR